MLLEGSTNRPSDALSNDMIDRCLLVVVVMAAINGPTAARILKGVT